MKKWYAVKKDQNDPEVRNGSRDRAEAERMARSLGKDAFIVIMDDNGETPVYIEEIHQEDFEN